MSTTLFGFSDCCEHPSSRVHISCQTHIRSAITTTRSIVSGVPPRSQAHAHLAPSVASVPRLAHTTTATECIVIYQDVCATLFEAPSRSQGISSTTMLRLSQLQTTSDTTLPAYQLVATGIRVLHAHTFAQGTHFTRHPTNFIVPRIAYVKLLLQVALDAKNCTSECIIYKKG